MKKKLYWFALSVFIIILDQMSKMMVAQSLRWGEGIELTSFFNLVHAENFGAAFSFMDVMGGPQRWIFALVSLVISVCLIVWIIKLKSGQGWRGCGLALILGGALGNLWDRFVLGHVLDFLDFHLGVYHWPAFNIADSAVCIGAFILVLSLLREKK